MGAVARGGEEGKKDKSYEYDAVVVVQNELQGDQKLESAKKKINHKKNNKKQQQKKKTPACINHGLDGVQCKADARVCFFNAGIYH